MFLTKKERLKNKFQEQIQFIARSCELYDKGFEDESIRIATSLRVVFHNTPASISLIKHLNFQNKTMLTSSRGHENVQDFLSWVININSSTPVTTRPILGNEFREISIIDWWNKELVVYHKNQKYTRQKVILNAANKDGGAHVDERLDKFYEALTLGNGVEGISLIGNLTYSGEPPFEQGVNQSAKNIHLALIRQFAHEFLSTVNHFDWLKINVKKDD